MKLTVMILMIAAFASTAVAQYGQWSSPVPITTGTENDLHPAIANGYNWMWGMGNAELMAFSRNGKNIGVIRTYARDTTWSPAIYFITNDSADNDFPSAFHTVVSQPSQEKAMLVWQGRRQQNLDILFSKYENLTWSAPEPIANTPADDRFPHVFPLDSGYCAVWEQGGQILFAQYSANQWTVPQSISQAGDTSNHLPQVATYYRSPGLQPFVMWERKKDSDSTYAIMYSARTGTTWSAADTLVYAGNNRRPRIFKYGSSRISWERQEGNESQCFAGNIFMTGGKLRIQVRSSLTYVPEYQRNASVNGFAVITTQPMSAWFSVAAWETRNSDSIGVSVGPFGGGNVKLSPGGNSTNTNPDVSQGNFIAGGNVRVWVVWEAGRSGRTKLYGSYTILSIGDVNEDRTKPAGFLLEQNYPNPFNPSTNIKYKIPTTSHVTLKVFDILGREVATLVDEVQDSGFKSVTFNGSGFASGVYSYRLQAGNFVETKKLMLMR